MSNTDPNPGKKTVDRFLEVNNMMEACRYVAIPNNHITIF